MISKGIYKFEIQSDQVKRWPEYNSESLLVLKLSKITHELINYGKYKLLADSIDTVISVDLHVVSTYL